MFRSDDKTDVAVRPLEWESEATLVLFGGCESIAKVDVIRCNDLASQYESWLWSWRAYERGLALAGEDTPSDGRRDRDARDSMASRES